MPGGNPVPAGVFDNATAQHAIAADRSQFNTLAITMEPGPMGTAAPTSESRLVGSSLLLINPPFGLEEALNEALPFLADALTKGQSGWRLSQK